MEDVRLLLDMKAEPKKYLDDPTHASSPEFLEVLGYAFQKSDSVGDVAKKDDVAHLRRHLNSAARAAREAVAALERTGSKSRRCLWFHCLSTRTSKYALP